MSFIFKDVCVLSLCVVRTCAGDSIGLQVVAVVAAAGEGAGRVGADLTAATSVHCTLVGVDTRRPVGGQLEPARTATLETAQSVGAASTTVVSASDTLIHIYTHTETHSWWWVSYSKDTTAILHSRFNYGYRSV